MSNSLFKKQRIFTSPGGDPSLEPRVTILENNEYKITYFTEISSSTGTITIPTGATILLDQFQGGVDAYVTTIQNGQPTGVFPQTGLGVAVDVTSFNSLGDYTLSDTPSSYPVALIYILKIKAIDYSNLVITNILDLEDVGVVSQTITNGVTDKAPSEDAVYDALALKGYVQPFGSTAINLAASTLYHWGLLGTALTGGIPLGRASVISKTGILTDVSIYAYVGGTIGSSQNCTIDLIISDMSGIIISTTTLTSTFTFNGANRANIFNASGLNITWTNGYVYTLKLTTGAFTTAPTSVQFSGTFFIKN